MHVFIILGDDVVCLDTKEDREWAVAAMLNGGIKRASVYRGGPEGNEFPEGRDFGDDGEFHYDGETVDPKLREQG